MVQQFLSLRFVKYSLLALMVFALHDARAQSYSESTLYQLGETDGTNPTNLVQAADGNFYGIASFGGLTLDATPITCFESVGCGTIFKITSSGAYSVIYTFQGGTDGAYPVALLQGGDGNLYGVAVFGGYIPPGRCASTCPGSGTIFKVTTGGTFEVLYTFTGASDGSFPLSLIQASDGNFYGTTYSNTIFAISPSGTFATLFTLGGVNGELPTGIVQGADGNLYGTTQAGGSSSACGGFGCGTIYKMSLAGAFSTIYTFSGQQDGADNRTPAIPHIVISQPNHNRPECTLGDPLCHGPGRSASGYTDSLTQDSEGNLYGTTPTVSVITDNQGDGYQIASTIFKISPDATFSNLYTFTGTNDGGGASWGLFLAGDGNLYGTSGSTIFQLTSSGTFSTIYSSTSNATGQTFGGLIQGSDGSFYSVGGGSNVCQGSGCGSVFALTASPSMLTPVQLTLSSTTAPLGSPVTLNWTAVNAFSLSMQQCYAFVQNGATTAGLWGGLQPGNVLQTGFTGSATLTPSHVGTYTYALTCGGAESGFATLTVPNPSITSASSLPNGQLTIPYSQTLVEAGGAAPYAWAMSAGALPPGLSLTSAGVITGTPTQSGNFSFSVQASDSEVPAVAITASFSLSVATPDFSVAVSPSSLTIVQGQQGTATFTITGISGYNLPVSFSCSGLPSQSTCNFSPAMLTPNATGATSVMTIATTAPSAVVEKIRREHYRSGPIGTVVAVVILLVGWLLYLYDTRFTTRYLCVTAGFALFAMLAGCGGGGGGSTPNPPPSPGTPTGTDQISITAASTGNGASQHSINFTIQITQ